MERHENLGPAEKTIQALLQHLDHMVHNRPGLVVADARTAVGVRWEPVTTVKEGDQTVVYKLIKNGPKVEIEQGDKVVKVRGTKVGNLWADNTIRVDRRKVADYRPAGIFPEVALWAYNQVAEVWKLDNEFAAKWASYAFGQEHRDLKVVLAAFMMVQSRKGDPVRENGEVLFNDDDYRDVGEAMCLITKGRYLNAKQLMRVHDILVLPEIAAVNRELGFSRSARNPALGRWPKAVKSWLRYREQNPQLLEGLVKSGFKGTVKALARRSHYKPESQKFFETLGWKQSQSSDGRRKVAIGVEMKAAESWDGKTEAQVCEIIEGTRPSWKVIVSRVPTSVGITRAIMAAAVEAGCLSDKDLIIATPTLEDLGLLKVQGVQERWQAAVQSAEDQRAANIARNVKNKGTKEVLQDGADKAVQKAVEEVVKDMQVYVFVDVSASMQGAIEQAKSHIEKFLQGFPLERLHVAVFNTNGREVTLRHASKAGVQQAFRGIQAGGGTDYGAGVRALRQYLPGEDEDSFFLFIGDEVAQPFQAAVEGSGLRPVAFGLVPVFTPMFGRGDAVRRTANALGVPCFEIDEATFEDPYAIPRTLRNLIAATPVGQTTDGQRRAPRLTLVETILQQDLLQKPAWAA